jgi:alginate export protein
MRRSFHWSENLAINLVLSASLFAQTTQATAGSAQQQSLPSDPEANKRTSELPKPTSSAQNSGDSSTPPGSSRISEQDPPPFSPIGALNSHLPKWLHFDSEYRVRLEEGLAGKIFHANTGDTYFMNRVRLGVTIRPSDWLKFHLEGQDARAFDKNSPRSSGFYDLFDLRQAYMELGDTEKGRFALRAGRQIFYWGEGRLVADSLWSFPGRSFDAVRGTLRYHGYRLDAFAASVVQINPAVNTGFTAPSFGNNIHGLYGGIEKLVPKAVIEPYVFWRIGAKVSGEDKKMGDLNFKTYGLRWAGKLPAGLDYGTEVAFERGEVADSDFNAWGGHWVLGHTWSACWKPRLFAEYNYATGDNNPKDGRVETFDVMYPSTHLKWGETDQVGWRNIHDVRAGFEIAPANNWTVSTNYHSYWLANIHDGLYAANGSVAIPRVPAGTAGRWAGQEADVQGSHKFHNGFDVGAGVGHIFPGTFIRLAASDHGYTYPYVMTIYTF